MPNPSIKRAFLSLLRSLWPAAHVKRYAHEVPFLPMMRTEPFRKADAAELVRMWRESFEYGVGIRETNPIEGHIDFLLGEVAPTNCVRVVMDEDDIVAFMASTSECVSQLYVRVQNIGQGLGSQLINTAKSESNGALWLYTFERNENARRFYERHGFREVERECENMYKLEAIKYRWQRVPASEA